MKGKPIAIRLQLAAMILFCLGSPRVSEPECYGQEASSKAARSDSNFSGAESSATPAVGKTVVGKASWYGPGLEGHKTATGERFDPNKPTAAAKHLPLGSQAVVTNLDNGRSVKVRINDCGPVPKGRRVDLLKKAAQKLHMTHEGTAPVKIKIVDAAPDAPSCESKSYRPH
jgi:rare lipoprotein A (peptidoglycan hydrolase)